MPAIRILTWNILPFTPEREEALFVMVVMEPQVDIAVVQEVSRTGMAARIAALTERFAEDGYSLYQVQGETPNRRGHSYLIIVRDETIRVLSAPVHFDTCFALTAGASASARSGERSLLPRGELRVPIDMELEYRPSRYGISLVTWHNMTLSEASACFNHYTDLAPVRGRFNACRRVDQRRMYVLAGDLNVRRHVVTRALPFGWGFRTVSRRWDHISALMPLPHTLRAVQISNRGLRRRLGAVGDHSPLVGELFWIDENEDSDTDTEVYDADSEGDTETWDSDMDEGPSGS